MDKITHKYSTFRWQLVSVTFCCELLTAETPLGISSSQNLQWKEKAIRKGEIGVGSRNHKLKKPL